MVVAFSLNVEVSSCSASFANVGKSDSGSSVTVASFSFPVDASDSLVFTISSVEAGSSDGDS